MRKYLLLIFIFLSSGHVFAALPDPSLPGYSPGAMDRQNALQLRKLGIEKNYIQSTSEEMPEEKKPGAEQEKDVQKGELIYNPHFKVNDIIFEGNTIYSDKKLRTLAEDVIGKEVYMEDVLELAVQISRFYQKNGYITSHAYIAPQEIKEGVVVISVSESRVEQKIITGNRWARDWYLENIALGGTHLSNGKVFNVRQLQGAVKSMNRENYMQVNVGISKNPATEGTIIELDVEDKFPLNAQFNWDDYGRDFTGVQRATFVGGFDNMTGFGDKIYGGTILATGSQAALAGYSIPLSYYGTRLGFDYSHSRLQLGGPFKGLGITGSANDLSLRIHQPFINNAVTELSGFVTFNAIDSRSDITLLGENLTNYNLRVVRMGFFGVHDDLKGRWLGSGGFDIGIDGLGATRTSPNGTQSSFYKLKAEAARVQRLPYNCLGVVRLNGQYTPQRLYAAEQLFLGGPYSIRGFQPSELLGDSGVAGSVEVRFPIPFFRKILPEKLKPLDDRIKLATFYDWGWVGHNNLLQDDPVNFLQSVGFGAYLYFTNALSVQIGVGFPLGQRFNTEQTARMYFSVNTQTGKAFLHPRAPQ